MQEKWTITYLPYSLIKEDIIGWLKENCTMKYHVKTKGFMFLQFPALAIKFESSVDAMAFKLRWL